MKHLFLFFSLLFFVDTVSYSQIITTIAGNDSMGYNGDDRPATTAKLSQPKSARPDRNGNVYIADLSNNRIRKVSPAGIITTAAGDGTDLYSGDGGPATVAQVGACTSVATDTAGNVYIAELSSGGGGPWIRKIDAAGIITTYAGGGTGLPGSGDGGPATLARFQNVSDITVDKKGNLYILDPGKQNLRKVDTAGIVSTIAGNGTPGHSGDGGPATDAQLYQPYGVAVDGIGNIYIADFVNNRIRKVDTAGIITTIAGDVIAGYSGDGGPASAAKLRAPSGVAVDTFGNIYIADAGNYRIRKITGGNITTVAGDSLWGHTGDGGPATAAELLFPWGVAVDDTGNIYIADRSNNDVRKVTMPPRMPTKVAALAEMPRLTLYIYPNPSERVLTVHVYSPLNEQARITITDMGGRTIKEIMADTNKDVPVRVGCPPGMYFVTAVCGQWRQSEQVVVR